MFKNQNTGLIFDSIKVKIAQDINARVDEYHKKTTFTPLNDFEVKYNVVYKSNEPDLENNGILGKHITVNISYNPSQDPNYKILTKLLSNIEERENFVEWCF
jgi:hypothetical protein